MGSGRSAYERAVDQFSRAVTVDPDFVEAYLQRGILYWREIQNYHHAIRDMTRVLALDPDRAEALYTRALSYQSRGDFDQAVADLEQFLAQNRDASLQASAELQLAGVREFQAARTAARSR